MSCYLNGSISLEDVGAYHVICDIWDDYLSEYTFSVSEIYSAFPNLSQQIDNLFIAGIITESL